MRLALFLLTILLSGLLKCVEVWLALYLITWAGVMP